MNSKELAWQIRRDGIEMTHLSNGSHIASVLSVADIIAVLYADILVYDPSQPRLEIRDRIILSKGHAGASIYSALAHSGFLPVEELKTHYANGSRLSGHVSHKGVPGVELSTGSLGHGLPIGCGMALAAKLDGKSHRVFVIMGDGECDEGSVWEAALFASHHHLSNLIVIIDHNKMQSLTYCEDTLALEPFAAKWRDFGFEVKDIDGHDHDQLRNALASDYSKVDKPVCVIANTIKGKGVSFMENNILWHYRPPQGGEYQKAVSELEAVKP